MQRSHWEMEVHAKDVQQRRGAETARQRRVDEAKGVDATSVNPFNLGIAQFVSKLRAWLSCSRTPRAAQLDEPEWLSSTMQTEVVQTDRQRTPRARPPRFWQPYADMVVIAQGPLAEIAEQPGGVRDC